jgi:alpha-1,6-mannosyltransferase
MFDSVICANDQLAQRLTNGGVANVETIRMGVEGGVFSPALRSPALREQILCALGLDASATLLVGLGRFSAEKRWEMVLRAVGSAARYQDVGLLLVGDGTKRAKLELIADRTRTAMVLPRITDRDELARLLASADALVHGCEAETFCLVAAEARASGTPMIVPDRGAAVDQLVPGAGTVYRGASEVSLERAIRRFIRRGPELQRAAAVRSRLARTMDEHFADLFARYEQLVPRHSVAIARTAQDEAALDLSLARPAAL